MFDDVEDAAVVYSPIHMHEQVSESRHALEPRRQVSGDDRPVQQALEATRIVFRDEAQPAGRDVVAQRQSGFDGQQQPVARDVLGVGVLQKILPARGPDALEPLQALLDFLAAPADDVVIEGHAAKASRVALRTSGA